jgi:hypothetical protein
MAHCTDPIDLPDWNEGIRQGTTFDSSYVSNPAAAPAHTRPQPLSLGLWVGRVRAGAKAAAVTHQHMLQTDGHRSMRIEGMHDLPNALDVEYWLNKAFIEEGAGRGEEAAKVLKEALARDVRPTTTLAHALQELQKRLHALNPPHQGMHPIKPAV